MPTIPPAEIFNLELPSTSPQIVLVAAVMGQAVYDLRKWTKRRQPKEGRHGPEQIRAVKRNAICAWWWLHGMPSPRLTFADCCGILGFPDPEHTRRQILKQFDPEALRPLTARTAVDFLQNHYFPPPRKAAANADPDPQTEPDDSPGDPAEQPGDSDFSTPATHNERECPHRD